MIHFQKPNKSLTFTLIFGVISFFTTQTTHIISVIIAATVGTIWAYQEALDGTNTFRRNLGIFGFICLAIYLFANFQ